MTTVHEEVTFEAPYFQAAEALEQRLGLERGRPEGRSVLTLIAPLAEGRDLVRDVTATTKMLGGANFASRYELSWPAGTTRRGIPTPGFDGILTLRAGEDFDESQLVLDGGYTAPGGVVGRIFDDVVGRRVAHATLGALLDGVRRALRAEHERIEAQKHPAEVAG